MNKNITILDTNSYVTFQFELDHGVYPIGVEEIKKYNRGKKYKRYDEYDCIIISCLFDFLKNQWVDA